MNEKPKVAIIIRAFNRGGAEVLIREMFENKNFNKNLNGCDLIILDGKRLELLKDLKNVNYYIINIFSSSFFGFFGEYFKLYKLIKEKKIPGYTYTFAQRRYINEVFKIVASTY